MERRQSKRVITVNPVRIQFTEGDNPLANGQSAHTINMSRGGAAIEISSPTPFTITVGREVLLKIALAKEVIAVRGRVIHDKQLSAREVVVGILFTEMLPRDRQALAAFLRE